MSSIQTQTQSHPLLIRSQFQAYNEKKIGDAF